MNNYNKEITVSNTNEAFIDFCDRMIITTESVKKVTFSQLTSKQKDYLFNSLDDKYLKMIVNAYDKSIKRFKDLSNVAFHYSNRSFRYDEYSNSCSIVIDCFGNYAYENMSDDKNKMKTQTLKFKKDLIAFSKVFQSGLPKDSKLKVVLMDDDGFSPDELVNMLIEYIDENGRPFSNGIEVSVEIPFDECVSFIMSESVIKESERKKYLMLYEEFIKFLKNPHKLSGKLWSGMISDLCKIMDISSNKLNQIVSKNIRPIGSKITIKGDRFDDHEFGNDVSKELGECYVLESFDADMIVYSINKKKLYWLNFEHCDCEIFFINYPMSSKEFEEAAYGYNDELLKDLKNLFNNYNKEHNIKF